MNQDYFCLPFTPEQDAEWLSRMTKIVDEFRERIKIDPVAEMLERAYLALNIRNEKVTYKKLIYNALIIAGYDKVDVSFYCRTFDFRMPLGSNMHDAAYNKIHNFVTKWVE